MEKQNNNKIQKKKCSHKNYEPEIIFGGKTGDYYCPDCGQTFTEKPKRG